MPAAFKNNSHAAGTISHPPHCIIQQHEGWEVMSNQTQLEHTAEAIWWRPTSRTCFLTIDLMNIKLERAISQFYSSSDQMCWGVPTYCKSFVMPFFFCWFSLEIPLFHSMRALTAEHKQVGQQFRKQSWKVPERLRTIPDSVIECQRMFF